MPLFPGGFCIETCVMNSSFVAQPMAQKVMLWAGPRFPWLTRIMLLPFATLQNCWLRSCQLFSTRPYFKMSCCCYSQHLGTGDSKVAVIWKRWAVSIATWLWFTTLQGFKIQSCCYLLHFGIADCKVTAIYKTLALQNAKLLLFTTLCHHRLQSCCCSYHFSTVYR